LGLSSPWWLGLSGLGLSSLGLSGLGLSGLGLSGLGLCGPGIILIEVFLGGFLELLKELFGFHDLLFLCAHGHSAKECCQSDQNEHVNNLHFYY
jgi:hypothetical protein